MVTIAMMVTMIITKMMMIIIKNIDKITPIIVV